MSSTRRNAAQTVVRAMAPSHCLPLHDFGSPQRSRGRGVSCVNERRTDRPAVARAPLPEHSSDDSRSGQSSDRADAAGGGAMTESILLTATRVSTFNVQGLLTNASGFFFERAGRLFLVTSGHVVRDEASGHRPDRIEIELHTDEDNLAQSTGFSILLYCAGVPIWRQTSDRGGLVDVAVIEIDRAALPPTVVLQAFSLEHLQQPLHDFEVGTSLLIVGFPLGFHDALHHLPVARHAVVASSFGLRFQGQGVFLTDARTHRGTSGAPVVTRIGGGARNRTSLPWKLLGIHSARLDMGTRDIELDESLGLNSAWYADVLLTLTN
jgi:hypothetical protein